MITQDPSETQEISQVSIAKKVWQTCVFGTSQNIIISSLTHILLNVTDFVKESFLFATCMFLHVKPVGTCDKVWQFSSCVSV